MNSNFNVADQLPVFFFGGGGLHEFLNNAYSLFF